ncbi:hypothetical protein [Paenibacillus azoreducens]|uniref:Uncharacterized protein n=1 Tax=Paenibacillus azoreducens TaxID=116718 RepID=A0A919YE37_9BACL|nr:hypothetical protein [Paenibacillus azoreducens]GIO47115.1 hypothetical protein J34TS1_18800 [Paenibacillus azoreducens]
MAKRKRNVASIEDLSSLELAKIGLTLAAIGDIISFLSIIKAEEEEAARSAENKKNAL